MGKVLLFCAILASAWISMILLLRLLASRVRRIAVMRVKDLLLGERVLLITDNAVYVGAEGQGPDLQGMIHGVLALTDRAVAFMPWHSGQPTVLPRKWLHSAVAADAFLSMTVPGHLLVVEAQIEGRGSGRMGWLVEEAGEWAEELGRKIETLT